MADKAVGQRILDFRKALFPGGQGYLGRALTDLVGGPPIAHSMVSSWERGEHMSRYTLAALAMLHPTDPVECLLWFQGERKTMPRLPTTIPSTASTEHDPADGSGSVGDDSEALAAVDMTHRPPRKKRRTAGGGR